MLFISPIALGMGLWGLGKYLWGGDEMDGLVRALLGIVLALYSFAVGSLHAEGYRRFPLRKASMTKAVSNCRQIDIALRAYASDHDGRYPDAAVAHPRNSNELFRKLFTEEYLSDERIFGCPMSGAVPDGNIGQPPDFLEALKRGENHWAMTKGLTDASPPSMPLVFENPAVATWPPKWNVDEVETPRPGRVWKGGKVIIGFNDGSAEMMPLQSAGGAAVGLAPRADGTPVFPDVHPAPEILNVER